MTSRLKVLCLSLGLFLLSGVGIAQVPQATPTPYGQPSVDSYGQPYTPPAWGSPAAPGFAPPPTDPNGFAPPPTGTDDSYFVPAQPTAPGFDYFEDEEYGDSLGGSPGGGSGKREVKDSFKLVSPSATPQCGIWGNSLLGPTKFSSKSSCEAELSQKVDQGYAAIEGVYDKIEFFKLKKVIRGDLASRAEAKKYNVKFDSLRSALRSESRRGCVCKDK